MPRVGEEKRRILFFTQAEINKKRKFFFSSSFHPENKEYIPVKILIFEILI
jgi:hypothetical protein